MAPKASKNAVLVPGLIEYLRAASKAEPAFDKRMRVASERVADSVTNVAKKNAAGIPPQGSGSRSQAAAVVGKLRSMRERVPVIKLLAKDGFVSVSRPNRRRSRKVTASMVFFGAEFGGRAKRTTQQFMPHRGRQGYFFWRAMRERRGFIADEYSKAIDDVLRNIAPGAE